jgi:hypothetical protein
MKSAHIFPILFSARRIFFLTMLFAVVFTEWQCTYDPDEQYFNEVTQPPPTNAKVSFFSITDTAEFRGSINLNLVSDEQSDVVAYKLSLNDMILAEGREAPYSWAFPSNEFPDGPYDLKLTLTKRVHSQSLASKIDREVSEQDFIRKVYIYNEPLAKPEITTSIENGILVLHWTPYIGRRFEKYSIVGSALEGVAITDPEQSSLSVPNFVGGNAYFMMSISAYGELNDSYQEFDYSLNPSITKTPTGIHFSWDESPFINYKGSEISVQETKIQLDKSQRSYDFDMTWTFPHSVSASIRSISQEGVKYIIGGNFFTTQAQLGRFDDGIDIYTTNRDSVFLKVSDLQGATYNSLGMSLVHSKYADVIKSRSGFCNVSQNGQLAYDFVNETTLRRIDPNTLEDISSFSVTSIIGTDIRDVHAIFVGNDNVVIVYVRHGSGDWYYAIDAGTQQLLFKGSVYADGPLGLTDAGKVSGDGKIFYRFDYVQALDPLSALRSMEYSSPKFEIALPARHKTVWWGSNYLVKREVDPPNTFTQLPLAKSVMDIFASTDNEIIGVAYKENSVLKILLADAQTLAPITTLETILPTYNDYKFFIVDRTLYIYIKNQVTFHQFDF